MKTASRTHGFTESVIRTMTRVANEHGAINLAQGFPNFSAPEVIKEAAAKAIHDDVNQYAAPMYAPTAGAASAPRPVRARAKMTSTRPAVATTSASR